MPANVKAERLSLGREAVFAQVKSMADEMEAEQFFLRLEDLIDQIRVDLDLVPDPALRAQLRELFREAVDYAVSLKLSDLLLEKAAQG
jgi:hypothetical protein